MEFVDSRDVEGGIRPEIGSSDAEPLVNLILSGSAEVLDMAIFGLDVVRIQISDGGDIRMRNEAVITLVIVIGKDLPVEVSLHVPGVIEVIFIEVVVLEAWLLIYPVEVILPSYFGCLAGVHVDPDKAIAVDVGVRGKEITSMECRNISLHIPGDDKLIASSVIFHHVAGVGDTGLVGGEKPFTAEDGPLLELIHGLRGVPGGWECPDRLIAFFWGWSRGRCTGWCRGRCWGTGAEVIPQERHCDYCINEQTL